MAAEIAEITSAPQTTAEDIVEKAADACESTQETVYCERSNSLKDEYACSQEKSAAVFLLESQIKEILIVTL